MEPVQVAELGGLVARHLGHVVDGLGVLAGAVRRAVFVAARRSALAAPPDRGLAEDTHGAGARRPLVEM
ncbi:hypothetical protein [Streptomyces stelliscabiei]|uniref:hypothetical protein n=1 Tax=Streptomyces stelliscabiei TaxID=146820 RepID=UPI003EC0012B